MQKRMRSCYEVEGWKTEARARRAREAWRVERVGQSAFASAWWRSFSEAQPLLSGRLDLPFNHNRDVSL
jgi:hypothetical protein